MLSLIKLCLLKSLPLMMSYLLLNLGGILTMIIIATLGTAALASGAIIFTTMGTIIMLVVSFVLPLSIQGGFLYGKGQYLEVGALVRQSIIIVTILGSIAAVLMSASHLILRFLHQPEFVAQLASQYFLMASVGFIPFCWSLVVGQLFIGTGDSKAYFLFSILNALVTVILTYILVKGSFIFPGYGMYGAGLSFTISSIVVLIIQVLYLIIKKRYRYFELRNIKKTLSWRPILEMGIIIAIQRGNEFIALMVFIYLIGFLLNEEALAAQQIMLQIIMFLMLVPFGLSQAIAPLTARYLGEKKIVSAYQLGWIANGCGLFLIAVATFVFWMNADVIIKLFANQSHSGLEVVNLTYSILGITVVYILIDTLRLITTAVLRGYGNTKYPMIVSLISFWLVGFPAVFLVNYLYPSNLYMMNLGFILGIFINTLLNYILLLKVRSSNYDNRDGVLVFSN